MVRTAGKSGKVTKTTSFYKEDFSGKQLICTDKKARAREKGRL